MEYICVERHFNGDWWYHPIMGYHKNPLRAIGKAKRVFWYDPKRPMKILKIKHRFPKIEGKENKSWFSKDCKNFYMDIYFINHRI